MPRITKRHILIIASMTAVLAVLVAAVALTVSGRGRTVQTKPARTDASSYQSGSLSSLPGRSSAAATSSVPSRKKPPASSRPASSKPRTVSTPAASAVSPAEDLSFQEKFPNLYVPKTEKIGAKPGDKVVYLTFDDGPSRLTPQVLQILKENDVKATFFLIGRSDEASRKMMKEIVEQGNAIGIHTYSHDYKKIYASTTAFLEDFSQMRDLIVDATGVEPAMLRFAGGSVNSFNKGIVKQLTSEMTRRGYTYYDWNVSSGDAERGATRSSIYNDTLRETRQFNKAIILFHDAATKTDTVQELPAIIRELKKSGYRFDKLDPTVKPIIFKLPK